VVEAGQADAVFELIYFTAGLDLPHAGMVMMGQAFRAAGLEGAAPVEDVQ
jgi:hypothetical protein